MYLNSKLSVLLTVLILFPTIFNVSAQNKNPNFDFSGIKQFWNIVDILKQNQYPTNNQWHNLFNTPGYKVLTHQEFPKNFFKNSFELVFMPTKKKDLDKALKRGINTNHLLHYIKVKNNRAKINEQMKHIKNTAYNRRALNRTLKFLPQHSVNRYPPVAFVIFENNGRGSSPIIVDLAATLEWDFESFLAHEYHHWYRNRELKFNKSNIGPDDSSILEALNMIEAEGIADMVDKRDWFTKSSNSISTYARQFINDVGRTPYIIHSMDKILSEINREPGKKGSLGRQFRRLLPQKGHTTGYFMASLILKKFSRDNLVQCVGNPFRFIKLYNKASKLSGGKYPGFSKQALNIINYLESKYKK